MKWHGPVVGTQFGPIDWKAAHAYLYDAEYHATVRLVGELLHLAFHPERLVGVCWNGEHGSPHVGCVLR